jgi:sugar phosphate isomerase/epimerase
MNLDRFTVCTICLRHLPPAEAFPVFAAAGFPRLDLFGLPPHFSADPREVDIEALEAACRQSGVSVANLGTYCGRTFDSEDAAAVEAEVELTLRTIALAQRLGARTLRILPGEGDGDEVIDKVAPHYRRVMPAAEAAGVDLVMENHAGRLAGRPHSAVKLCEAVGSPRFGIIYEPCNLLLGGEDYREALEVMAPWVRHVHFKDGRWRDGKFEMCHYGEGDVDLRWCVARLDSLGYGGDFAVEYEVGHLQPVAEGLARWRAYLLGL